MVTSPGAGSLAVGAAGALLLVVTALDLFLTVFNYDGFTFIARRFHAAFWSVIRSMSRPLPERAKHAWLSLGSAAMLPATVALWLGLEITAFAMMFEPGIVGGAFKLAGGKPGIATAYYASAGVISSLSFGDVVARAALDRALIDLETIVGLATFTLALGYVVTAFGVLDALENLHGAVRRHADDPERPSSILARHFRGGNPSDLPSYLQALGDELESYEHGLRRYPVVYYFHTRRTRRSIPHVFAALGDLAALLRWGLPSAEPMTQDPFLAALIDGYESTLERLRRSFVGPRPIELPEPVPRADFGRSYTADEPGDDSVSGFKRLEWRARTAAGSAGVDDDLDAAYERYAQWLPFAERQRVVLDRVADRLGYARPGALGLANRAERPG